MLRPNAAERILAKDAILDPYFTTPIIGNGSHLSGNASAPNMK